MPLDLADVIKLGNKRVFIQRGGPGPQNTLQYTGVDGQYMSFTGAKKPISGGASPIIAADPFHASQFAVVGAEQKPVGDFASGTLEIMERVGTLPFVWSDLSCPLNVYIVNSVCKDPSAFDKGWEGYTEVWGLGQATDVDGGDRALQDSDAAIKDKMSMWFRRAFACGSIQVGDKATTTVLREIKGVALAPNSLCGNCGIQNNGFRWQYATHGFNTGVTAAAVLYSTDYGATWTSQAITGAANTEDIGAIAVVGDLLVVLSPTGASATQSALYYTTINQTTGIPGATWTKVSTGFPSTSQLARDMVVLSPREVFFVCDSGYILKSTSIPAGVSTVDAAGATTANLARIKARGDVLVAHGATGKTVKSLNRGRSWALTTADPHANTGSAVEVINATFYWVGSTSGDFYYTLDGGISWTNKAADLLNGVSAVGVQDITAPTPDVLFVCATVAGPLARICESRNGGLSFVNSAVDNPRILNLPSTTQRVNRLVVPDTGDLSLRVNNFLSGGLGATTDGALLVGQTNDM